MKLTDLRPCDACDGPVGQQFYVVRSCLAFVAPVAGNQVLGLARMFQGNMQLAETFAPDADCVKVAGDEDPELWTELLLCQDCYLVGTLVLAEINEATTKRLVKES